MQQKIKMRHGDTLVEVMLSITVFSVVAVTTLSLMNKGINTAQKTLEIEMARRAMSTQRELIEFIHQNARNETFGRLDSSRKCGDNVYCKMWLKITTGNGVMTYTEFKNIANQSDDCSALISTQTNKSFVLNPRGFSSIREFDSANIIYANKDSNIVASPLYPRIMYSNTNTAYTQDDGDLIEDTDQVVFSRSEGLWVVPVRSDDGQYYDFYIRTCWNPAGSNAAVNLTTMVRLYDPGWTS